MLYLLALLSGAALAFSQPPARRHAWQLVALLPFLWATTQVSSLPAGAALGALVGLSYAAITLIQLRLPPTVSAILIGSQSLTWIIFGALCVRWHGLPPLANALLTGAGAAFLAHLETRIVPLWGSAQLWTRGWAHAPRATQFVCFTGAIGVLWWLVTLQSLLIQAWRVPSIAIAATIAGLIVFTVALNEWLWRRATKKTVRVATLGWAGAFFDDINLTMLGEQIAAAARQGAQILVAPEAAFRVSDRDSWRREIGVLAARHQIYLALGYFDNTRDLNCIDFVAPDGSVCDRYVKTHLVPVYETYTKGSGRRACAEIGEVKSGGVICQDDNFSDIARGYGRDGTQLLCVPTNDWSGVQHFHLTSTLWRALEMRYAVARATSDGISVIASARGQVVRRADHFVQGLQRLTVDVAAGNGRPTFYARRGDWLAWACGLAALVATLWAT